METTVPSTTPPRVEEDERNARQAAMLENRLRKRARVLQPWAARERITAYRLYDSDIPELRLFVDRYGDHAQLSEHADPERTPPGWFEAMADATAKALELPAHRVHRKTRRRTGPHAQYERQEDATPERVVVQEGDFRFMVDLTQYLDTGLFLDRRGLRALVRKEARERRFLNLFSYTGSFTCAAGVGGATETTSVDLSNTYLDWTEQNLRLNRVADARHELVRADVRRFLARAATDQREFQLCVVDPPTFSQSRAADAFDVQRDHRDLLLATMRIMAPGGVLYFTTARRGFVPDLEGVAASVEDLSDKLLPKDFRDAKVHRVFRLKKAHGRDRKKS